MTEPAFDPAVIAATPMPELAALAARLVGPPTRHPLSPFTAQQRAEIAAQYRDGVAINRIARQHERAEATIRRALVTEGVTIRTVGNYEHKSRLSNEDVAAAAAEYLAGDSARIVAERLGVTPSLLRAAFRRAGVVKSQAAVNGAARRRSREADLTHRMPDPEDTAGEDTAVLSGGAATGAGTGDLERVCEVCQQPLTGMHPARKVCSRTCRQRRDYEARKNNPAQLARDRLRLSLIVQAKTERARAARGVGPDETRACVVCGESLAGRRVDAVVCGASACKVERKRRLDADRHHQRTTKTGRPGRPGRPVRTAEPSNQGHRGS